MLPDMSLRPSFHGTKGHGDYEELPEEGLELSRRLLQRSLNTYDPARGFAGLGFYRHIDFETLVEIAATMKLPESDMCQGCIQRHSSDESILVMFDHLQALCHSICDTNARTRFPFQDLTNRGLSGLSIAVLFHFTRPSLATDPRNKPTSSPFSSGAISHLS